MPKRSKTCITATSVATAQRVVAAYSGNKDLADLSLEELANVQVTSVTGRPAPAHEAAASLYVITGDDIRRG